MREFGQLQSAFWTDQHGRQWPVPTVSSYRRLDFRVRAHAALRSFVFQRDGYACRDCGAQPKAVPDNYDGRFTLWLSGGTYMVVDHVVSACRGTDGGHCHHPSNLQTLCDRCNARKCALVDLKP